MKLTIVLLITLSVCAADPELPSWLTDAVVSTGNFAKDNFLIAQVIYDNKEWIMKAKDDTVEWIQTAVKDTTAWFSDIIGRVIQFYTTYIKPVIDDLVEVFTEIKNTAQFVVEKIAAGFNSTHRQEVRERIMGVFNLIVSKADKYIYASLDEVEKFILKKANDIGDLARRIADDYTSEISAECQKNITTDITNYQKAFMPKLTACVGDAKQELLDVYKVLKSVFLSVPAIIMDIIEKISTCVESMRKKPEYMCIKTVGQDIMFAGTSVVMDIVSVKILIMNAVKKVAESGTCVTDAAKSLFIERKSLQDHLEKCGMEFAVGFIM